MHQNLKIAITDETHLNAVCDALESMGFKCGFKPKVEITKHIETYVDGVYDMYPFNDKGCDTTLTDLLAIRDKQIKAKAMDSGINPTHLGWCLDQTG